MHSAVSSSPSSTLQVRLKYILQKDLQKVEFSEFAQETIGPDPHSPDSPLPPSAYAADIGYLVDGTPLDAAGNNAIHWELEESWTPAAIGKIYMSICTITSNHPFKENLNVWQELNIKFDKI